LLVIPLRHPLKEVYVKQALELIEQLEIADDDSEDEDE
jgi:hypothetical protein